jgi:hypothetical protein
MINFRECGKRGSYLPTRIACGSLNSLDRIVGWLWMCSPTRFPTRSVKQVVVKIASGRPQVADKEGCCIIL